MSLLRDLLNAGIQPNDAQVLDQEFANEPDFLTGMEQIARVLAINEDPGILSPAGEPWKAIHYEFLHSGLAFGDAFNQGIANRSSTVQMATSGAVAVRMRDIQQYLQQSQQNQGKKRKTVDYEKVLKNLGLSFRFNECTLNYEVNGEKLSDGLEAQLRMRIRDAGVWEVNVIRDVYIGQAWANKYHPVKDYLTSLTFKGGDPIAELATYFQDEHGIFPCLLRRWLIGAVAKVLGNGLQNRMLILEGRKGLGKSDFVRWLAKSLPKEYHHEGTIDPDPKNKDHYARLIKIFIWEVNEFSRMSRRSDRDELKAFLTTQQVEIRMAYDRRPIVSPAMASFIGTANNEYGLLSESDRRFMIAHLVTIDWNYSNLDVDQVWAQAVELYLSGERWEPTPDELKIINEVNDEYQTVDIVEETIRKFFNVDPNDIQSTMSTLEILNILKDPTFGNLKAGTEIDTRRLATALTRMGLAKPKLIRQGTKVGRGYVGIRLLP